MAREPVYSYDVRVGACADYLLGRMSVEAIALKWGIKSQQSITQWIQARGCFKLRNTKRQKGLLLATAVASVIASTSVSAEVCTASHYGRGDGYHGGRVACRGLGPFNTYATAPFTVAHRTRACGSYLTVTNLANGRSLRAMVTDRGPFVRGRCIDLGYAGARAIGMGGLARVSVE